MVGVTDRYLKTFVSKLVFPFPPLFSFSFSFFFLSHRTGHHNKNHITITNITITLINFRTIHLTITIFRRIHLTIINFRKLHLTITSYISQSQITSHNPTRLPKVGLAPPTTGRPAWPCAMEGRPCPARRPEAGLAPRAAWSPAPFGGRPGPARCREAGLAPDASPERATPPGCRPT